MCKKVTRLHNKHVKWEHLLWAEDWPPLPSESWYPPLLWRIHILKKFSIIEIILNLTDREELITERALRWNKRKIVGMVQSLSKRYIRVSVCLVILQASWRGTAFPLQSIDNSVDGFICWSIFRTFLQGTFCLQWSWKYITHHVLKDLVACNLWYDLNCLLFHYNYLQFTISFKVG